MCSYVQENKCKITNEICPYVLYCNKLHIYKPSRNMPAKCSIADNKEIPKGYCKVIQERKGFLYIDVNGNGIKVENPFNHVPLYVKVRKLKNGSYKLTE